MEPNDAFMNVFIYYCRRFKRLPFFIYITAFIPSSLRVSCICGLLVVFFISLLFSRISFRMSIFMKTSKSFEESKVFNSQEKTLPPANCLPVFVGY